MVKPGYVVFGGYDLQLGKPLQDATKDQGRQRHLDLVRLPHVGGQDFIQIDPWPAPTGQDMKANGQAEVLGCGPERIIVRMGIWSILWWRGPDHHSSQSLFGNPLHLCYASANVLQVNESEPHQPLGVVAGVLRDKVVVRPKAGGPQPGVIKAVEEHTKGRVQHLATHPVSLLLFDPRGRIPHRFLLLDALRDLKDP